MAAADDDADDGTSTHFRFFAAVWGRTGPTHAPARSPAGAAKIVVKTQDLSLKEGASIKVNLVRFQGGPHSPGHSAILSQQIDAASHFIRRNQNLGKKPDSFGGARGSAAGASGSAAAGPATGLAPPPAAPVAMAPPPLPVKLAPPPAGGAPTSRLCSALLLPGCLRGAEHHFTDVVHSAGGLRLAPPPPGHARGAPQAAGPAAGAPPPLQPPPAAPHWPQQAPAAAGDPQLSGAAALLAPPPTLPSKPLPPPPPQPQPIVAQQHDFGDFAAFQS